MNEKFLTLLEAFARERGFVRYQIDSYNDFVVRRIPKILESIGTIKPEVPDLGDLKIKLGEFRIGQPSVKEADGSVRPILPMEARMRNLTYAAPMFVEMTAILNGIETQSAFVNFGDLPVMVKSKICPLSTMSREELIKVGEDPDDPGGYFIINGTERILVLVEEIAPNRVMVEKVSSSTVTEIARIHSEKDGYIQKHLLERRRNGIITISFANITRIPIVVLMKALGLESDKEILTAISLDEEVQEEFYVNIYEAGVASTEEAFEFIGRYFKIPQKTRRMERVKKLLDKYLLPHLGQKPANRLEKAIFLAKAVEKLLKLHLDKIEEDDIDHYSNKRLKLAGDLLELLLRAILLGKWGLITRITYNYQKLTKRGRMPPLQAVVESNVLTNQIVSALAIGTWVGGRTGISQRLERGSYVKTVSHMRNVLSPLTSTQEHFEARELHPTHWGKLCPSETPEGATIGLRKYLATMAEVTFGVEERELKRIENILESFKVER
ncbi:MAG TPA: DNA-directed RNA polymerase subunit B'' [Candidatus Aenigmarchaeota archaeon]|nr:DNA-directed RNA polymerase subunit B'' [Candidatus Aenigmarchaeota archaeon]